MSFSKLLGCAALALVCVGQARAAFTDNFALLRDELQTRSDSFSNSTDKTELKLKKACDKAIATIDKEADALADDVKTAGKLAKSLEKAFPAEFVEIHLTSGAVAAADASGAEWVQSGGLLDISGARATGLPIFLNVTQASGFTGQPGNYALGGSGGITINSQFFACSGGTLHIETFNSITKTTSGTFTFTATNGVDTVTVSNGAFDLSDITITP